MDLFIVLAIILGMSALFSYINERLLHLETLNRTGFAGGCLV
jgi:hypothetical protein